MLCAGDQSGSLTLSRHVQVTGFIASPCQAMWGLLHADLSHFPWQPPTHGGLSLHFRI
jgi:hypothetical protein